MVPAMTPKKNNKIWLPQPQLRISTNALFEAEKYKTTPLIRNVINEVSDMGLTLSILSLQSRRLYPKTKNGYDSKQFIIALGSLMKECEGIYRLNDNANKIKIIEVQT